MPLIRAQVSLQRASELPEDLIVNTFYFRTPTLVGPTEAEFTAIQTACAGVYNSSTGSGTAIGTYMSSLLAAGTVHTVKQYNMDLPKPRPPARTGQFSIMDATGQGLPAEVSLCLSYRAALIAGVDPKNRRGRVYIGPFDTGALANQQNGSDVLPAQGLMNALRDAGVRLMNLTSVLWVVYSPTNNNNLEIVNVHCDNAFDTQRRRGGRPTARTSADKSAV
jgi:hypothetical protein